MHFFCLNVLEKAADEPFLQGHELPGVYVEQEGLDLPLFACRKDSIDIDAGRLDAAGPSAVQATRRLFAASQPETALPVGIGEVHRNVQAQAFTRRHVPRCDDRAWVLVFGATKATGIDSHENALSRHVG